MGMTAIFSGDGEYVDVDKAWHLIHFLLTGQADGGEWPLGFILNGGARSGADAPGGGGFDDDEDEWADEDGTSQTFTPAQVREIAAALAPLTPEVLATRWNAAEAGAQDVYAFSPDDETLEYAISYYAEVRELVLRLAEKDSELSISIF